MMSTYVALKPLLTLEPSLSTNEELVMGEIPFYEVACGQSGTGIRQSSKGSLRDATSVRKEPVFEDPMANQTLRWLRKDPTVE